MAEDLMKKMAERIRREKLEGALEVCERIAVMDNPKGYAKKQVAIFRRKLERSEDVDIDSNSGSEEGTAEKSSKSARSSAST